MAGTNVKQSKLDTSVAPSSVDGVVVGFFAGVVTGGRVPVASNLSATGVGKVAAFNAGARVGLGYGPWNKCKKTVK